MKSFLNLVTVLGNISLFVLLAWLLIDEPPETKSLAWILVFAIEALFVLNVYFVAYDRQGSGNWFELFLKRKALEEQKKIDQLKKG